jgi:carboxypeptidase family protein/tetratricopeptide repeat protein
MMRLSVFLAALSCWVLYPCASFAQSLGRGVREVEQTSSITGNVYYAGWNQPAENIQVELRDTAGNLIAPQVTNASGQFEFHHLPRGNFVLVITAVGYETISLNVDTNYSSSRGNDIYLKPTSTGESGQQRPSVSAHELSMPRKSRDLVKAGKKKFYVDKDIQGALKNFQEAVAAAPDYYEAYYEIGMDYLALGKPEDADRNFRKSIELSGDKYGESEIGLGTLMLNKSDFANGEKAIRHGLELAPKFWLGYYELGRVLMNQNRIADAENAAEKARSLSPNSAIIYRLLANVHMDEKNYPALLKDLDAYIKLDPNSPAGARAREIRTQVAEKVGTVDNASAVNSKH